MKYHWKIISLLGLCLMWGATGFAQMADEVIIPGKLSWAVKSIEEVWTVDVSETTTKMSESLYHASDVKFTETTRDSGTTKESEHKVDAGAYAYAKAGVSVKAGLFSIPNVEATADTGIGGDASYRYNSDRKYWDNNHTVNRRTQTQTTDTKQGESSSQTVTRYNRRLRIKIQFFNLGDEILTFRNTGDIRVFLEGEDEDLFFGHARCNLGEEGELILIRPSSRSAEYWFELNLNDTEILPKFDSCKYDCRLYANIPEGQLKFVPDGMEDSIQNSIVHHSGEPFRIVMATPEDSRQWDIMPADGQTISLHAALEGIDQHCRKDAKKSDFIPPFQLDGEALTHVRGVAATPRKDASAYVIAQLNGEILTDSELLALPTRELKPEDTLVFCILDNALLNQYLPMNHGGRSVLREYQSKIQEWGKAGKADDSRLEVNLEESPEEFYSELRLLADSGDTGAPALLQTLHVPGDLPTLPLAYECVNENGTILLTGDIELEEPLKIGQNVTIASVDSAAPVTLSCKQGSTLILRAPCAKIQNLTLENHTPEFVESNSVQGNLGDYARKNSTIVILAGASELTNCRISGAACGILISGEESKPVITNCDVAGCGLTGIWVEKKGNPAVSKCKIHDGKMFGIYVFDSGLGTFTDCEIYGNTYPGMIVETAGNPTVTGCKMHDGKTCGILVLNSGLGTFTDCEIYGNTYSGIEIKTQGNPTVKSCKIHDGKARGILVHGSGLGTFTDCEIYGNTYSGIQITTQGNPTVKSCKIHDGKECGIFVLDSGLGTFTDCEIYGNTCSGIQIKTQGNPTVKSCKIHDGKQDGIYVYDSGLGTFSNCEIYGNWLKGRDVDSTSNPKWDSCNFHDNSKGVVYSAPSNSSGQSNYYNHNPYPFPLPMRKRSFDFLNNPF